MGTVEYPTVEYQDGDDYWRSLVEKNFEINEVREIIEHEQGNIEWLSIAVSIDKGLSEDDVTAEVKNLVSKAIGVSEDNVAVESILFSYHAELEKQQADKEAYEQQMKRKDTLQMIIMWAVILLLGLAFISLIKAIVKANKPPEPEKPLLAGGDMQYEGYGDNDDEDDEYNEDGIDYLADEDISVIEQPEEIELNKKSTVVEQIEKFIDKDPEAVAQLLRNWLSDEL